MNSIKKIGIIGVCLFSAASLAEFNLDLNESESEVCRTERQGAEPTKCLPRAIYGLGLIEEFNDEPPIPSMHLAEIASQLISGSRPEQKTLSVLGGTSVNFMSPELLDYIVANYKQLKVKNLAAPVILSQADVDQLVDAETGHLVIPIFFDVHWISARSGLLESTLHVEAEVIFEAGHDGSFPVLNDVVTAANQEAKSVAEPSPELLKAAYLKALKKFFPNSVVEFSDSNTESQIDSLRFLETALREAHIKIVAREGSTLSGGSDVDAETLEVLEQIVMPIVVNELILAPQMERSILQMQRSLKP